MQSWTDPNSASWRQFDQQAAQYGRPTAVWVQICIFAQNGATYDEVRRLIANARQHAAPGARRDHLHLGPAALRGNVPAAPQ